MTRYLTLLTLTLLATACAVPTLSEPATANEPAAMQGILAAHNQLRAALGIAPLRWSGQMQDYAQQWATHLAQGNGCQMQHRSHAHANPLEAGENLYWASPLRWSDGRTEVQAISPAAVAQDWASEAADYNVASNTCRPGAQCGHYTQMVWRTTTEVGCGMAVCPDKGQIWVCSYNPPGNWVGERPY
jgi:pathogenesis-related protein 1